MFMVVPPKELIVMQGIPGSGKSTVARKLLGDFLCTHWEIVNHPGYTGDILSTDDYWTTDHQMPGQPVQVHNPAKIGEAHLWNQRRAVKEFQKGTNLVIIDNTNIKKEQAQPYVNLGNMFNYRIQVVSVSCGLDEALRRNAQRDYDRRVPEDVVRRMYGELEPLL